jgi:hypothetical protein
MFSAFIFAVGKKTKHSRVVRQHQLRVSDFGRLTSPPSSRAAVLKRPDSKPPLRPMRVHQTPPVTGASVTASLRAAVSTFWDFSYSANACATAWRTASPRPSIVACAISGWILSLPDSAIDIVPPLQSISRRRAIRRVVRDIEAAKTLRLRHESIRYNLSLSWRAVRFSQSSNRKTASICCERAGKLVFMVRVHSDGLVRIPLEWSALSFLRCGFAFELPAEEALVSFSDKQTLRYILSSPRLATGSPLTHQVSDRTFRVAC